MWWPPSAATGSASRWARSQRPPLRMIRLLLDRQSMWNWAMIESPATSELERKKTSNWWYYLFNSLEHISAMRNPIAKLGANPVCFGKKSHSAEKNWKGGPFGIFQHPFWRKKNEGGPFGRKKIPEKSLAVPKKMEGGPFGLAGYGMLRGKTGKTFLVQFARPNSAIWCNNIL